jgi:transcriptional regulator with XRE-family HTH domain
MLTTGKLIRARRTRRKLLLHEVAATCGIAESTLCRYELDRLDPQLGMLAKIADALGCGMRDLIPPKKAA